MESINSRIARLRNHLGLNQSQFARTLGVTSTLINKVEAMKAPLTDANIRLICFIFGVNEEWLREGTGEMMDEDAQLSEKSKRMLSIFESVSDAAQDLLIEYAEKLIDMEASLGEEASHRGHKNISRR